MFLKKIKLVLTNPTYGQTSGGNAQQSIVLIVRYGYPLSNIQRQRKIQKQNIWHGGILKPIIYWIPKPHVQMQGLKTPTTRFKNRLFGYKVSLNVYQLKDVW